jgi:hypothetical protein
VESQLTPFPSRFLQDCAQIVSFVVLYYDHALTFPEEVRIIWSRMSWKGSWIYLANRYLSFAAYITVAVANWTPLSTAACNRYLLFREGLLVLSTAIVTCEYHTVTLRTHNLD